MTVELTRTRERLLLLVLGGVQFSAILDFMLLMPLGPQLMRLFDISPAEFGVLVSVYMGTASAVGFAAALVFVRLVGRLTDLHGRRRVFALVAGLSIVAIFVTTHLPAVPLWGAVLAQMLLMLSFAGRFVPAMTIITGAVVPEVRGIFMSFNAAFQQLSAGLASLAASAIVARGPGGEILYFGAVGWVSMVATFAAIALAAHVRPAPQ